MRLTKALALASILAIGALGFVACNDDDNDSVAEGNATLCADLNTYKAANQSLAALNATSTIDEFKDARADVVTAWDDVLSSAADVTGAKIDDLESAYDDLYASIKDVDDDASVATAVVEIQPEVAAVNTAWDQYYSAAGCK